jgi:DNA adenine methylase
MDPVPTAVWRTILHGQGKWLADRIATFDLTLESVEAVLSRNPCALREKAFQAILRNRINHGGILAPGAGMLNYGEHGKGI